MVSIKSFMPREYQKNILESAKKENTLVCLPTGTGKTKSAILVAVERLNKFPSSKVVVVSPTKPLANQIANEFRECIDMPEEKVQIVTGMIKPEERKKIFEDAHVVVATPQTIRNDMENELITLKDTSLLVIDECHRSKQKYAYTAIARRYIEEGVNTLILALTASPGASKDKVEEICKNLFIKKVEIRTEEDEDIAPYVQEKKVEFVKVYLSEEVKAVHKLVKEVYKRRVGELRNFGLTKPASIVNKRDILAMQMRLRSEIDKGGRAAYAGVSLTAQCIKLAHMVELLETQPLSIAKDFLEKLKAEETKAAKAIMNERNISLAYGRIESLLKKGVDHPKMEKVREVIQRESELNPQFKGIVFATLRGTISEIVDMLEKEGIKARKFVGQADRKDKGLTQEEQAEIIKQFREGEFSVLVASSVAEEGLDIPEVNAVILFEATPNELRKIQRSGRTGRTMPGKVICLLTEDTRDIVYHWSSHMKEKKMRVMLKKMKEQGYVQKELGEE